jgi:hypothetical protein
MSLLVDDKVPVAAEKPDDVETQIIQIATAVSERAIAKKLGDKLWTGDLILRLGELGKRLGYYVCAPQCRELENGQGGWLYDLVWLKNNEGCLIGLPLVLETEWSSRKGYIDDDFQKLLVARAEHRVMICQGSDPDRHFKRFIMQVRNCGLTQVGDRYLFLCFDWKDHKFKPRVFVA